MRTTTQDKNISGFTEIYRTTCEILSTFRGRKGKQIVQKADAAIKNSPELSQFVYELVCNAKAVGRSLKDEDE